MKLRKATLLILFAVLVAMATPALAAVDDCNALDPNNLVQNCGFETGNFNSWTVSGNDVPYVNVLGSPYNYSGNFGASLGPVGPDAYLSQFIWGNDFRFAFAQNPSFWGLDSVRVDFFGSCGAGCGIYYVDFELANFGGTPNDFTLLWNGADVGPSLFNSGTFPYTEFNGYVYGNTPESGSLILLGSGVLGLAGVLRRKLML